VPRQCGVGRRNEAGQVGRRGSTGHGRARPHSLATAASSWRPAAKDMGTRGMGAGEK
jgi:hypothetical protein